MNYKYILTAILVMAVFSGTASAWLTGYDHRMAITVNNGGASSLSHYQFNFTNDTNVLVSAGEMQASGADCRITDASDNLLPFWNETPFNATGTRIWVNATTLAVGDNTFYMYYGNAGASAASNISKTFMFGDDFTGTVTGYYTFQYVSKSPSLEAHQGVATDGTYFYTSSGGNTTEPWDNYHLYKWDADWNQLAHRDTADDAPTDKYQINSVFYKDGKLYVGAFREDPTPKKAYIIVYNASDLSYDTYHEIGTDMGGEGCVYHDGYWWCTVSNQTVRRFNESWGYVDQFKLTFEQDGGTAGGYEGLMWIGDYLYANIHDGVTPTKCDVYHWNGTGFDEVTRLDPPTTNSNQGLCLDPDGEHVWWAERNGNTQEDPIVKTSLLPPHGVLPGWTVVGSEITFYDGKLTWTQLPERTPSLEYASKNLSYPIGDFVFEGKVNETASSDAGANGGKDYHTLFYSGDNETQVGLLMQEYTGLYLELVEGGSHTTESETLMSTTGSYNTNYYFRITRIGATAYGEVYSDVERATQVGNTVNHSCGTDNVDMIYGVKNDYGDTNTAWQSGEMYYVFVRQYASPEPTATLGAEETGGGGCGAYNITLPLGWSIIGWTNPTASTAHSMGTLIGGNCQYVTERNSTTGLYVTHVMSNPTEDNFATERGWGYFVKTTAETLWERDS